ncbi:hypothetical protein AJ79_00753 [Helicocarpus griseus UAMH5409]|uniref:Uncharacterized protein n=1 Tax=Helicocarpus griseus UAMH5409 TaxID=1447875 RepID=A0A2B7YA42_9EURO|nr:hypothetical protein AJ79_00753 [Helicocarpus griseus UAMH5409]
MFTTFAHSSPISNPFAVSSPLSPHNAGLPINRSSTSPMSRQREHTDRSKTSTTSLSFSSPNSSPTPRPRQSYADRYATQIRNPSAKIARQHASLEKRRDMFLNKVKRDRDEGIFEARGEQIQRITHLAQQRRYEEAIAQSAPDFGPMVIEEEEGEVGDTNEVDERLLQELISQEEEYQAFIEALDRSGQIEPEQPSATSSQYDDEEDYEHIFVDLLDHDQYYAGASGHPNGGGNSNMHDGMDMDTSHG